MVRRVLLAGLVAGLVGSAGCRHCCGHRRDPLPPQGGFLDDPLPPRSGDLIPPPPGGLPSTAPLPGDPIPRGADPGTGLPPPTIPDSTRNFRPDAARPNGPQLLLPDPLPGMSRSAYPATPRGSDLPPRPAAPAQTAALPSFSVVKPGLATGRKPAVEGFDAVKARGYRTVVYLHAPADDVSAAKDLAERKGLAFVGIPTSPETLKTAFERFRNATADPAGRPTFVFDDDGARAGSLWYLYFRVVEQLGDDAARVRAAPLGLREIGSDEQTRYWIAIQDYLAKR